MTSEYTPTLEEMADAWVDLWVADDSQAHKVEAAHEASRHAIAEHDAALVALLDSEETLERIARVLEAEEQPYLFSEFELVARAVLAEIKEALA